MTREESPSKASADQRLSALKQSRGIMDDLSGYEPTKTLPDKHPPQPEAEQDGQRQVTPYY